MTTEPKTQRGRATRERIIACADALIAERGVSATSLEDILAGVGASKSQMYHYFGDRQDLVHAVVARRCEYVVGEIVESLGQVDSIRGLERWLDAQVAQQRRVGYVGGCPIGSLATELADRDDDARSSLAAAFDIWEGAMESAIRRIQKRGELRPEASPAKLATALLASAEGGLLLSQTRKSGKPLRTALDAWLAHLRSFAART